MTRDDGRNIDPRMGALTGEAASQAVLATNRDITLRSQAFPYVPSRQSWDSPTYYDHPMLKQPPWIWSIPLYFYVGGVAGAGAAFGAAAQLIAPRAMHSLIMQSRWIATLGGALSAALLIHDLGRPARFLNMLRVFRVSSPMSIGSWILTLFSSAAGAAALLRSGPRICQPLANAFGLIAGVLGLGLAGYSGVLLSQTAVPLWKASYRITPVLFLSSASAAAASFFEFFQLNSREASAIEWFGSVSKMTELAASFALEANARRIERVGRPLISGFGGFLWQSAKVFTVARAVISIVPGKSRSKRVVVGVLGSLSGICLRFGLFYAGKSSARDPRASFEQQRKVESPTLNAVFASSSGSREPLA
ncbi:MAG: NrfD/PsrC family molybdoenzyme membrane anchor subunit [Bryobacteraceae bacterium]